VHNYPSFSPYVRALVAVSRWDADLEHLVHTAPFLDIHQLLCTYSATLVPAREVNGNPDPGLRAWKALAAQDDFTTWHARVREATFLSFRERTRLDIQTRYPHLLDALNDLKSTRPSRVPAYHHFGGRQDWRRPRRPRLSAL